MQKSPEEERHVQPTDPHLSGLLVYDVFLSPIGSVEILHKLLLVVVELKRNRRRIAIWVENLQLVLDERDRIVDVELLLLLQTDSSSSSLKSQFYSLQIPPQNG